MKSIKNSKIKLMFDFYCEIVFGLIYYIHGQFPLFPFPLETPFPNFYSPDNFFLDFMVLSKRIDKNNRIKVPKLILKNFKELV